MALRAGSVAEGGEAVQGNPLRWGGHMRPGWVFHFTSHETPGNPRPQGQRKAATGPKGNREGAPQPTKRETSAEFSFYEGTKSQQVRQQRTWKTPYQ